MGVPWDGIQKIQFLEAVRWDKEFGGGKLGKESLMELKEMFEARKMDDLKWVLDDDVEVNEDWVNGENESQPIKTRKRGEAEVIRFLVDRLVLKV